MENVFKPVFLKPAKERALLSRHPWVFSGAIGKIDESITIGDAVKIMDHEGKPLALGHWCAPDGLVIRVLSFATEIKFDRNFFQERFLSAKQLRDSFGFPSKETNGFRLINGEGDGLSGLVCDLFSDTASIQCNNPGLYRVLAQFSAFLVSQYSIKHIFCEKEDEKSFLQGSCDEISFLENNLSFFANPFHGQKTGHFLDQRNNRALLSRYAKQRVVLDCFCYSGGFSVYALAGGAKEVNSVDISKSALELCEKNITANNLSKHHKTLEADCFSYLRTVQKDQFDLIVLDPPAFAKTAASVMRASRGYKDINLLAMKAIKKGGLIFSFSCSQHIDMPLFKKIIFAAARDSEREVKIVHELSQGVDHPVSVFCPQNTYLKGLVLYVE